MGMACILRPICRASQNIFQFYLYIESNIQTELRPHFKYHYTYTYILCYVLSFLKRLL